MLVLRKIICIISFLMLFSAFSSYSDTLSFEINSKSRKIMVDGFLFEWAKYSSKNWSKNKDDFFDIGFTSEGWCGYITFIPKNKKWNFLVFDSAKQYKFSYYEDSLNRDPQIRAAFSKDKRGVVIVEWALLDKKAKETKSSTLMFTGYNEVGDSLPVILTNYMPITQENKINLFSFLRVLTIFGVLIFFISIVKKPISKDSQEGLPRQ